MKPLSESSLEETNLRIDGFIDGFRDQVDYQYRRSGQPVSKIVVLLFGRDQRLNDHSRHVPPVVSIR